MEDTARKSSFLLEADMSQARILLDISGQFHGIYDQVDKECKVDQIFHF